MPKQALIMIDMQRGFLDSASPLCIPSAEATVPRARRSSTAVTQRRPRHLRRCGITAATAPMWKSRARPRGQPAGKPLSEDAPRTCRTHFQSRSPFCAGLCARKAAVLSVFPHRARPYFAAGSACRPSCSPERPRPTASARRVTTRSRSIMMPSCSRTAPRPSRMPCRPANLADMQRVGTVVCASTELPLAESSDR